MKQVSLSTNKIHEDDSLGALYHSKKISSENNGLKLLCESSSNRKLVKLKSPIVSKFSQVQLKFIIVIVQSKNEIVKSMQIVQSAARIIGKTVSK